MDLGLKDKVAVVTGAASKKGIGRAIALTLAREGVNVAVTDIAFEGAQSIAGEIREMGRRSIALKVDQRIYQEVRNAVIQTVEEFEKIDILVNGAAIISNVGAVRKMEPSRFVNEINVNLIGPWYWTREVMPVMIQNQWGRIVNISSLAGMIGLNGLPAYAASKAGLIALTKTTAIEGATRGVAANSVSLGLISTGIYDTGHLRPEAVAKLREGALLGRMGEVNEVADAVVFLCSDRASYITGANLVVDGGTLIKGGA